MLKLLKPDGTARGLVCPLNENKVCAGDCHGCPEFDFAIRKASANLCPVCGADVDVWQEMFGEVHYCDPAWGKR